MKAADVVPRSVCAMMVSDDLSSSAAEYIFWVMQVLANPSADIQESPAVSKADLKQRGIRPYDEKVCSKGLRMPARQHAA